MLTLLACAAVPPSREEVLAACDIERPAPFAWSQDGFVPPAMSSECVGALGESVGMDWARFGMSGPQPLAPADEPLAVFFGGLFTLLAADIGTVGELDEAAAFRDYFARDERTTSLLEGVADDEPAGPLFWDHAVAVIERTILRDSDDYTMAFSYSVLIVNRFWLYGEVPWTHWTASNTEVAGVVVHEASHAILAPGFGGHVEEPGTCTHDLDTAGAFGREAYWLWAWSRANADRVYEVDAEAAAIARQSACSRILDRSGFIPCEGSLEGLCSPAAGSTPMPDP